MTVLAWAGTAYSQAVVTIAPTLTLRPAVVLSLSTEAGKGYQMQAFSCSRTTCGQTSNIDTR